MIPKAGVFVVCLVVAGRARERIQPVGVSLALLLGAGLLTPPECRRWQMLAAFTASFATVPYVYSFETQRAREPKPASALITDLGENVAVEFLISSCFIVLGLRLRKSLALTVTLLDDWPPSEEAARRRVRDTDRLAMMLGIGMGIVLAIADYYVEPMMPKPRRPLPTPPAWTGLLASVGAGIQEEIWTRLG